MKEQATKAAARVSASGIGDIAKHGIERALAARGATVLSEEQTEQVGGGIEFVNPIIYGGPFFRGLPGVDIGLPKTLGVGGPTV